MKGRFDGRDATTCDRPAAAECGLDPRATSARPPIRGGSPRLEPGQAHGHRGADRCAPGEDARPGTGRDHILLGLALVPDLVALAPEAPQEADAANGRHD